MSTSAGPNIVENGLVLSLDPANTKSLNIPTQSNHGYADWYCFVSGTATYSIINNNGGVIYENNNGTITTLVTANGPQRGTISITAGRKYYGSVPINLVVEDAQHSIAPLTMMGTQFWHVSARNNPTTYYIYSPYSNATINFYDNTTGGLTATPTSTTSLTAGQSTTITSNNLTNQWISSNTPVIISATQSGWDRTILSPMAKYVYQRFQNYWNTTNNTTATNANAYAIYDSTYNVMAMSIADGSGGDSAQGLGLEYLSDIYSWGNVVSDYTIVFPYNATVTAEYWNGTNWIVWDTHIVTSGSITNPPRITRDGTNGPGVEATVLSGAASNMASGATLWRWVGTAPFYLCINDSADDEFSVLGWLQSTNSTPRNSTSIVDISGNSNNGTLNNSPIYSTNNSGELTFNGINTYISVPFNASSMNFSSGQTICMWIKPETGSESLRRNPFNQAYGGPGTLTHEPDRTINYYFGTNGNDGTPYVGRNSVFTVATNELAFISVTRDQASNICKWYKNGILQTTQDAGGYASTANGSSSIFIGSGYASNFLGKIYAIYIYNRSLSDKEIAYNFNALRGRYGI